MKSRKLTLLQIVLPIMLCAVLCLCVVSAASAALAAPNLSNTAKTIDSITMSWSPVTGADHYRFYKNGIFVATTTGTSYTSAGLDSDMVYGFKVCAVDSSDVLGAYSSNVYVRTKAQLAAPGNLRVSTKTTNSIKMFWNSVPNADHYRFYKDGVFVANTTNLYFTSTGLTSDTVYGFKVVAVDSDGKLGAYSANVYTRTYQYGAPANLHDASKTKTSITMTWTAVPGAAYYRFYKNGLFLTNVIGTSYTVAGLTNNTVYGFKVAAVGTDGKLGQYSSNVFVRTEQQLAAPGYLHDTAKTATSITMAWNAVTDAVYYRFYKDGVYIANVYGTSYTASGLTADTVYGFKVAAVNYKGIVGLYSSHTYVRTNEAQLPAPANLHASAKTATSITMAWDAVAGADHYRFYVNGGFFTTTTGTSYTVTSLSADTVYGFKVAAVSGTGYLGVYSGHEYVRTLEQQLPAPANLHSVSTTATMITMAWNSVPGAAYYRVFRNGVYVGFTYGTSYVSTGLTSNTTYSFRVAAMSATNLQGVYSAFANVKTLEAQLPAPTNLHAAAKTTTSITMTWNAVTGASYYRFYQNGIYLGKVFGTSYTSSGLSASTTYGFKVAAVSATDWLGIYTANVFVDTLEEPLAAPQNLHSTYKSASTIFMAWDEVPGASYYRFYRNGVYIGNVYTTSFSSSSLTADTVYGFKVAAVSASGQLGAYSPNVYVRTEEAQLAAPLNLEATVLTTSSITMTWDAVPGASYYRFYRDGVYVSNVFGTSFTATGLAKDSVYGFKVAAVSASGTLGLYSNIVYSRTLLALPAPENLQPTGTTANSISIAWDGVPGAIVYLVFVNDVYVDSVSGNTYTIAGLDSGTQYSIKVAAMDYRGDRGALCDYIYVSTQ